MVEHVIGAFIALPLQLALMVVAAGLLGLVAVALAWVLYHAAPGWWARTLERAIEREDGC